MARITAKTQALQWLYSMANSDDDSFDSINAQTAYDIIIEQNRKLSSLGAAYKTIQAKYQRMLETMDDARNELNRQEPYRTDGFYCDDCQREVPSAVILLNGKRTRICLRCGSPVFDPDIPEYKEDEE